MTCQRILCLTLFLSTIAPAQSAAEQEIIRIEAEGFRAYFRGDAAAVNKIEGMDQMVINERLPESRFEPMRKSRSFNRTPARQAEFASMKRTVEKPMVRFLANGNVAIFNAIHTLTSVGADGKQIRDRSYITSVWEKRNGAWEEVNYQSTPVPVSR